MQTDCVEDGDGEELDDELVKGENTPVGSESIAQAEKKHEMSEEMIKGGENLGVGKDIEVKEEKEKIDIEKLLAQTCCPYG